MRLAAFLIAIAGAWLLNQISPPMARHPNHILAVIGWGLVICAMPAKPLPRKVLLAISPLLAAIAVLAAGCASSWIFGHYPASPAIPTLAIFAVSALAVVHGAGCGAGDAQRTFIPFSLAVVIAGSCSALIAIVQIVAPDIPDTLFYASTAFPGRAAGNLGQPNHLADTLLWALAALLPLWQWRKDVRGTRVILTTIGILLTLGLVLTGSRAGYANLALLAAWGAIDRGLPRAFRYALMTLPVVALCLWGVAHETAQWRGIDVAPIAHASVDITTFRRDIWRDTLRLVADSPWLGVGWGQFNFAWTLTPIAYRPAGFVDNAHDLPLQLAVELGIPCAALILVLLGAAAWFVVRGVRKIQGTESASVRAGLIMLVVIGVHSLVEFPLWYAYLLLPTAWVWGFALGAVSTPGSGEISRDGATNPARSHVTASRQDEPVRLWRVLGLLVVVAGVSAWFDYRNITAIYLPAPDAPPLSERLRLGAASPLFARHAEYTRALSGQPAVTVLPEIERSAHVVLDSHLLYVWAMALSQRGETDKARYLAARLREFHLPETESFFAVCQAPERAESAFQCQQSTLPLTWRDFR